MPWPRKAAYRPASHRPAPRRAPKPLEMSSGVQSGPRWTAYCRLLRAQWFRAGERCHYCSHPFAAPELIEVCHLLRKESIPAGTLWRDLPLAPGHGRNAGTNGNRRCPVCQLNCNYLSFAVFDAPRDPETGLDLRFPAAFIAREMAKLKGARRRSAPYSPVIPPKPGPENGKSASDSKTASKSEGLGRDW